MKQWFVNKFFIFASFNFFFPFLWAIHISNLFIFLSAAEIFLPECRQFTTITMGNSQRPLNTSLNVQIGKKLTPFL